MAIIIFTERHSQKETLEFIQDCYSSVTRSNLIFCLEDAAEAGRRDNQVTPDYLKKWTKSSNYYGQFCHLLLQFQQVTSNRIYNIDTAFPNKKLKDDAFQYVGTSPHGNTFEENIMFYRDQHMTKQLIKLQADNPGKDIVLIVGANHGGIFYHLLFNNIEGARCINSITPSLTEPYSAQRYFFDAFSVPYPVVQYGRGRDCITLAKAQPEFTHPPHEMQNFRTLYATISDKFANLHEELESILQDPIDESQLGRWCKEYNKIRSRLTCEPSIVPHLHTQSCYTMGRRLYGALSSLALPATMVAGYFVVQYFKTRSSETNP